MKNARRIIKQKLSGIFAKTKDPKTHDAIKSTKEDLKFFNGNKAVATIFQKIDKTSDNTKLTDEEKNLLAQIAQDNIGKNPETTETHKYILDQLILHEEPLETWEMITLKHYLGKITKQTPRLSLPQKDDTHRPG